MGLRWWDQSFLTTTAPCRIITEYPLDVMIIPIERTPLHCSPTPTFTLLRYVSTAGSSLFTQELRSSACFGLSFPSLSPFPLSPKMHTHSNIYLSRHIYTYNHHFLKGVLQFAQQRVVDPLPCALYNLPLVQPELSACVWVCLRSAFETAA